MNTKPDSPDLNPEESAPSIEPTEVSAEKPADTEPAETTEASETPVTAEAPAELEPETKAVEEPTPVESGEVKAEEPPAEEPKA